MSEWLSDTSAFLEGIKVADLDELRRIAKKAGEVEERDQRPLKVMVSSPRNGLEEERKALLSALSQLSDIRMHLFEDLDSGLPNEEESVRLTNACDIFLAIFEPGNVGSPIGGQGANADKFYSELEFETAVAKKRRPPNEWPLIFVYVKNNEGALTGWHERCLSDCKIAPTAWFTSTDELVGHVAGLLLRHSIELRSTRVRELSKIIANKHSELETAAIRLEARNQQVAELSKSAQADLQQQAEELGNAHRILVQSLQTQIVESRRLDQEELTSLREANWRQSKRIFVALGLGVLVGLVPAIVASLGGKGDTSLSQVPRAIENAGHRVAQSIHQRPIFVQTLELDPMLLYAKIALAKRLNPAFDCGRGSRATRELTTTLPAPAILIDANSVCSSTGPLVLDTRQIGNELCRYEDAGINPESWPLLVKWAEASGLRLQRLRIVGHASDEEITSACGDLSTEIVGDMERNGQRLGVVDGKIRSNAQLAYARAWKVRQALRQKMAENGSTVPVDIETLGSFGAKTGGRANDRGSTIVAYFDAR